jgi:diguanylate cyclase
VDFHDGFERAAEFARASLSLMQEMGVPPTPENLAIWHAYFAKADPDLAHPLDGMLEGGEDIDAEGDARISSRLFERDMETEAIRQAGESIEASLAKVLAKMDEAGEHASRYGARLKDLSGHLHLTSGITAGEAANFVRGVVINILDETRRMRRRSDGVASELKRSSAEIVELKRNLENVRREANVDGPTRLANRRAFERRLGHAIAEARETGEPLSLLMVDIDHFKRFNDQHGHQLGDEVLRLVARILEKSVKGRDTVARYGGEEFAIILPRTALSGAATVAEQIRVAVATRKIIRKVTGDDYGTITLSIGAAQLHPAEPGESLVRRADEALDAAKRSGRDQVATAATAAKLLAS